MTRRHIVIAASKGDVVIVTPRSPHAAQGVQADAITVASTMFGHPGTHDLIRFAEPALLGAERPVQGAWDAMLAAEARAYGDRMRSLLVLAEFPTPPPTDAEVRALLVRWRRDRGW